MKTTTTITMYIIFGIIDLISISYKVNSQYKSFSTFKPSLSPTDYLRTSSPTKSHIIP